MPLNAAPPATLSFWEASGFSTLARIRGNGGQYVTQASLASITCAIFLIGRQVTQIATLTVPISSSIFDTLQTNSDDPRWTLDDTGFNFVNTIGAGNFAVAGQYRAEFTFTPVVGDPFYLIVNATAQRLLSRSS